MKNLEGIQVGDRVWQRSMDRRGEVVCIDMASMFELRVDFGKEEKGFTIDGRILRTSDVPDLFFDKMPEPEYPKRPIMLEGSPLKTGDVVYYNEDETGEECKIKEIDISDNRIWFGDYEFWIRPEDLIKYFTRTKPKRKVKKTIECWGNVFPKTCIVFSGHTYSTKEVAQSCLMDGQISVKLKGEYEVTE